MGTVGDPGEELLDYFAPIRFPVYETARTPCRRDQSMFADSLPRSAFRLLERWSQAIRGAFLACKNRINLALHGELHPTLLPSFETEDSVS